jgi:metal-dependent amidase/aminoacylase/carboxypeptidase family protein
MDIKKASAEMEEYVIRCRRWFHEHAELSDQEEETVAFILEQLQEAGIECVDVPKGGVMGFIDGAKPGKTVLSDRLWMNFRVCFYLFHTDCRINCIEIRRMH